MVFIFHLDIMANLFPSGHKGLKICYISSKSDSTTFSVKSDVLTYEVAKQEISEKMLCYFYTVKNLHVWFELSYILNSFRWKSGRINGLPY